MRPQIVLLLSLLAFLTHVPQSSAQSPCTDVCTGKPWLITRYMHEFSPGCFVEIIYEWRMCGTAPDFDFEVYITEINLITECYECEAEFLAKSISGWIFDARTLVSGNSNVLNLAPGDLTIAWAKCWINGNPKSWTNCGGPPCCERDIPAWTPGNHGDETVSDPGACSAPDCQEVCE